MKSFRLVRSQSQISTDSLLSLSDSFSWLRRERDADQAGCQRRRQASLRGTAPRTGLKVGLFKDYKLFQETHSISIPASSPGRKSFFGLTAYGLNRRRAHASAERTALATSVAFLTPSEGSWFSGELADSHNKKCGCHLRDCVDVCTRGLLGEAGERVGGEACWCWSGGMYILRRRLG